MSQSQNEVSVDELLATAKQAQEEMKEDHQKLRHMEQECLAFHINCNIEGFGNSSEQTEILNNLMTAGNKVEADDAKIAQFAAFTKEISDKCDEMEQIMIQEPAMLEPSDSSKGGSESVKRLGVSSSNDQETEDIL